jgi:hypothetical protein
MDIKIPKIVSAKDIAVLCKKAGDVKTSQKDLKKLAEIGIEEVRINVASNVAAPEEALRILAKDSSVWVLIKLAANPNLPYDVLLMLSKLPSDLVRASIANHSGTPVNILENLSHDDSSYVLEALAFNVNTPYDILMKENFLRKMSYLGAQHIFSRKDFTKRDSARIIYGDYPECVIKAAASNVVEEDEIKTYMVLKYGNSLSPVQDGDRFSV